MKNINERNNFVFEFRPVTELFEEQVKLHPEKCAVVSGKESFTYAQLNERANRIANALVEKGVRRQCGQFTVNLRKIVRFYPNYIL